MKKIDTAIILAAGFGTRLKHLTNDIPKALVEFKGKPMIENVIGKLESYGIKNIFINTHHHHQKMDEYFKHRKSSSNIQLLYEKEILGTGGAIKNAEKFLSGTNDFLIYNTDVDSEINLYDFEDFHFMKNSIATLAVQNRMTSRYLLCDSAGVLLGRIEHEKDIIYKNHSEPIESIAHKAFCGIHILNNTVFNSMPPEGYFEIISVYINMLKKGLNIYTFDISEVFWKDLGIPENL